MPKRPETRTPASATYANNLTQLALWRLSLVLREIAQGQHLDDKEELPDDLYPARVLDAPLALPAATDAPANTGPAPQVPPPPADKQTKLKAPKETPAAPLIDPGLLNGWKQLRDLQRETAVSDIMMKGGFRKAYSGVAIPKSALTDTPPPWVTKPMIENMYGRLKKNKQSLEVVKDFADHAAAKAPDATPEAKQQGADQSQEKVDQDPGRETLDF